MSIEARITEINNQLEALGSSIRLQGFAPPDLEQSSAPERAGVLRNDLTPAAFWSHYVSGKVAGVANLPPDMSDMVSHVQRELQVLTKAWMIHPVGREDELNLASSRAFLDAGSAFDWAKSPSLLSPLSEIIANLADQYSLREGRVPLGYSPR